jgi:hypothetical protein
LDQFVGELLWLRCDEFEADLAYSAVGVLLDEPETIGSEVEAGRRVLSRLSDAQTSSDGVTVLAIDDAQWMDSASAQAVRFALRRLRVDRVLTVVARRPYPAPDRDLIDREAATAVIRPAALDAPSVRQFASQLRSWDLPVPTVERVVQRTGGLPLLVGAALRGVDHPDQLLSEVENPYEVVDAAVSAGLIRVT